MIYFDSPTPTKNIAIDAELHRQLKARAAELNVTLYELTEQYIKEGLGINGKQ